MHGGKGIFTYVNRGKRLSPQVTPPFMTGHSWISPAGLKKLHKHLSGTEAKWEVLRRKNTCKAFLVAAKYG